MRKQQRRARGMAALVVLVGMAVALSAHAGPIKLPRVPPDPPMIGDPDGPDNLIRPRGLIVWVEHGAFPPTIRVIPVVNLGSEKARRPKPAHGGNPLR